MDYKIKLMAYGVNVFGIMAILGIFGSLLLLFFSFNRQYPHKKIRAAILFSICSLILYIFFGSLFSKAVWGQYWSWDPKETALMLICPFYILSLIFCSPNQQSSIMSWSRVSIVSITFLLSLYPPLILKILPDGFFGSSLILYFTFGILIGGLVLFLLVLIAASLYKTGQEI